MYHMLMGKLSEEEVRHIAELSNIELSDAEVEKFRGELSQIIGYVDKLSEVDTSKVEMTSQTTGLTNVLRDDNQTSGGLSMWEATAGTENIHNGYFVVPQVLEGGE